MKIRGDLPFHVVVGLGKSGLSAARFLESRGWPFAVTDTRENPPGLDELRQFAPTVGVSLGELDEELITRANVIVLSPGLSLKLPIIDAVRRDGIEVIGDIELFVRVARAPIIAITGSNGKSTVTALVAHLLRHAGKQVLEGGNLGTPALDLLQLPRPDFYVLELSSFQLETLRNLHAAAATVLNISEDHMDRYGSLAEYAEAKARIYHHAEVAVLNGDDRETWREKNSAKRRTQFSLHDARADYGIDIQDGVRWLMVQHQPLLEANQLSLTGEHNLANALAALALCEAVGVKAARVRDGLMNFPGLPHRCALVREHNQVRYYNDSKATNVGAALAAIGGLGKDLSGKLIVIAGGEAKGQNLSPLTPALASFARAVIVLGRDADLLAAVVPDTLKLEQVESIEEAVQAAAELAQAGDVVVLAPACASLDMFRNYEERGERFAAAVMQLRN